MATLADAQIAMQDLEGWLLSLPHRRRITPEDVVRLSHDLHRVAAGLAVIRKYLSHLHAAGWEPRERDTDHRDTNGGGGRGGRGGDGWDR